MTAAERQQQNLQRLQERYRMLDDLLATLERDRDVETRNEEVTRIAARIADTKAKRAEVEKELAALESGASLGLPKRRWLWSGVAALVLASGAAVGWYLWPVQGDCVYSDSAVIYAPPDSLCWQRDG